MGGGKGRASRRPRRQQTERPKPIQGLDVARAMAAPATAAKATKATMLVAENATTLCKWCFLYSSSCCSW